MTRLTDALAGALLVASLAWAGPAAPSSDLPDTSWVDREQLEAGDIEVQASREDGAITVDTATLIDASPEAIWRVVTACEIAPEYVPNVVDCKLIETLDDGRAELFVQTVKPAFFIPRFEHVFRLEYFPYDRIDVQEVSGPIDRMRGSWWFLPEPEGRVLLMHTLEVHPGFPVPRFVLRATMRRDLVAIMEAVRDLAESGALE